MGRESLVKSPFLAGRAKYGTVGEINHGDRVLARHTREIRKEILERRRVADDLGSALIPDPPESPPETWADREGRARHDPAGN